MIVKVRINRKPVMIEMSSADKTIKTRTAQACLCRFRLYANQESRLRGEKSTLRRDACVVFVHSSWKHFNFPPPCNSILH